MKKQLLFLIALMFAGASVWAQNTTITVGSSGDYTTIQAAVNAATAGDIIEVAAGTYTGNITVNKNISLIGAGANVTTLDGEDAGGGLGTITLASGRDGVTIQGFHIIGIDGPPGVEKAAVYLKGTQSNITINGNIIEARGDAALMGEYNANNDNITISGNEFTGQTFTGSQPSSGNQYTVPNVARQAIVFGGSTGTTNTKNFTFINNTVATIAAGTSRGNTLVTLDLVGANTISGNYFTGKSTAEALRVRGSGTYDIVNNDFSGAYTKAINRTGSSINATCNWWGQAVGPKYGQTSGAMDKSTWLISNNLETPICAGGQPVLVYRDNVLVNGFSTIQVAVNAATAGDMIEVAAGAYTESVTLNKALTLKGANAGVAAGNSPGSRSAETVLNGGFYVTGAATIDGFKIINGSASGSILNCVTAAVSGITVQNSILQDVAGSQNNGLETTSGVNDLTLTNNTITNNYRGIYFNPGSGHVLNGNLIDANNGVGVGIGSDGLSHFTMTGNTISNHDLEGWGSSNVGTNVVANNNAFLNNTVSIAHYGGSTINADCNWWGQASGPAEGQLSGDVAVTSWLTSANLEVPNCTNAGGIVVEVLDGTTQDFKSGHPTIQSAIDAADAGDIVNVPAGTFVLESRLTINKSVTLNGAGMGQTIITRGTAWTPLTGDLGIANLIGIGTDNVTISDLTVTGAQKVGGANGSGINAYEATGLVFTNVESKDNQAAGFIINGSSATMTGVSTSGNGWYAANVARGSGVTQMPQITVDATTSFGEAVEIMTDNDVPETNIDFDYEYVLFGGETAYNVKPFDLTGQNNASVNDGGVTYIYGTIQAAINAATAGDVIQVAAGTFTEAVNLNKAVTLKGANAGIAAGNNPGERGEETILDGGVHITAAATIDGFQIKNGRTIGSQKFGIRADVDGIIVQNCIVQDVSASDGGIVTIHSADNLSVTNNTITNNYRGIYFNSGSGHVLNGNLIDANNGVGVGIGSDGLSHFTMTGNTISNHNLEGWGSSNVGTNVVANNNAFLNNTVSIAHYGGSTINADCNWWALYTLEAIEGLISGEVSVSTILLTDDLSGDCGQPWPNPVRTETETGSVIQYFSSLQAAINGSGDRSYTAVVNVSPGTYSETLDINVDGLLVKSAAGAEVTTLDGGNGSGEAEATVRFSANNAAIEGFTIDNQGGPRCIGPKASTGTLIKDNILINSQRGVQGDWYGRPTDLTIEGNTFQTTYGVAGTEDVTGLNITANTFETSEEGIGLGVGSDVADVMAMANDQTWDVSGGYAIRDYRDNTIYVTEGGSIQAAIEAASPGDVIKVAAGIFSEKITIDRSLSLQGNGSDDDANATRLDCMAGVNSSEPRDDVMRVADGVSDVVIKGFRFEGDGIMNSGEYAIRLAGANGISNIIIQGNTIVGTERGIYLNDNLSEIIVQENLIEGVMNWNTIIVAGWDANATLDDVLIKNNEIRNSTAIPILLMNYSNSPNFGNVTVEGNFIHNNDVSNPNQPGHIVNREGQSAGILVRYDWKDITIQNNIVENNLDMSGIGIWGVHPTGSEIGSEITNLTISGNLLRNNTGSDRMTGDLTSIRPEYLSSGISINLKINDKSSWTIVNNSISGNSRELSYFEESLVLPTEEIDVTCNWWGTTIISEIEAIISGEVDFLPFLLNEDLLNPICGGPGAMNERTSEFYDNLQAAIDDAEEGDTIIIYDPNFIASVDIDKEITIIYDLRSTTP